MPIKLVVSDVDGTLVTPEKVVSPSTVAAAHRLHEAGIHLALVSSRPPKGMAFLTMDLGLRGPLGGFNGCTILAPDGAVIEERLVPEAAVRASLELFAERGIGAWLFTADQWLVQDLAGDYVAKEQKTVRFEPTVVESFEPFLGRCGKVVGACADFGRLETAERDLQCLLGSSANAHRSQRYYLDVTNPGADKGTAVQSLARWFGVDAADVCAIGDQENDLPMFRVAGHSVAMGNAPESVAALARYRTTSNGDDGWAAAIDRFVLNAAS